MALPGELRGLDGTTCCCGEKLELQVCRSAAGYYLGYFCGQCGPYSRETGYFRTRKDAAYELEEVKQGRSPLKLRDTEYHPEP